MSTIEEMRPILKEVFTEKHPTFQERLESIRTRAYQLHAHDDYDDMIHDELVTDPTRTDDAIANDLAMRVAFP